MWCFNKWAVPLIFSIICEVLKSEQFLYFKYLERWSWAGSGGSHTGWTFPGEHQHFVICSIAKETPSMDKYVAGHMGQGGCWFS